MFTHTQRHTQTHTDIYTYLVITIIIGAIATVVIVVVYKYNLLNKYNIINDILTFSIITISWPFNIRQYRIYI